jgi:hypothetical protein
MFRIRRTISRKGIQIYSRFFNRLILILIDRGGSMDADNRILFLITLL